MAKRGRKAISTTKMLPVIKDIINKKKHINQVAGYYGVSVATIYKHLRMFAYMNGIEWRGIYFLRFDYHKKWRDAA